MNTALPILAFGITNLAMLGWLAVAAAPILIHLWSRRRYRETSWAAVEFLLAAVRQSRRRLWLEQWLLLLIRTLIVVLVVLAVSEPYLRRGVFILASGGARTHRVLVIDGSYSMAFRPTDRGRFAEAKVVARQIVHESPRGDGFSLVLMSDPPRAVVHAPALAPEEFLREIDSLTQPQTTTDLPRTLAMVDEVLRDARREQPGLEREEVYFLTDLGRVGWTPPRDAAETAAMEQLARRLGREATLVVIDLGQADAENQAITQLRTTEALATTAQAMDIEVSAKNFGREARKAQQIELLVDGRAVQRRRVDLAAGAAASVGFSHRFESPGEHAVEARLQADSLDIDNHRWLALSVRPSIAVLCVDGRYSSAEFAGAAGYLKHALAPRADEATPARVRPELVPESALLETELNRYDAVFLCDVAQFTASEARSLTNYVRGGGGLVVFLGGRAVADRYNRQLGGKEGLLPATLGKVVDRAKPGLDPLEYRHPIVEPFRGRERAGLLTTPLDKYVKLDVPADSSARVALATASGDSLVVERPFGRGRVILVATSADTSWTAMPMWPSYVPIVQQLLNFAIGGRASQRGAVGGQSLGGIVPASSVGKSGTMQTSDGRREPLQLRAEGDATAWNFDGTTTSGVYTTRFGKSAEQSELLAVNVDTVESNLEKLTEDQLRAEVLPGVAFDYQTTWEAAAEASSSVIGRRATLARPLLYAVLSLLFVETFLAWKYGAR
jgi:Mg-chelatase subunit ChlD